MKPPLRACLLRADGAGELEGADVLRGDAEHPVCGDVVSITCRVVDGAIEDLAWRAEGCPATLAVASAARAALSGSPVAAAPTRLRAHLASLGDLAAHERHAEKMVLRALQAAVASARGSGPD